MKRFFIGIMTLVLGMSGYAIVDKTIEDRVETLESQVSEMKEEISNLKTTVVIETEILTERETETITVVIEEENTEKEETKKHLYYASGMSLVEGRWQSCGWTIEAESFLEAAKIAEADIVHNIEALEDELDKTILYQEVNKLKGRDKEIIEYRYGLNGKKELTQKEVATLMGISQSYISRIEKKVIKKLKNIIVIPTHRKSNEFNNKDAFVIDFSIIKSPS